MFPSLIMILLLILGCENQPTEIEDYDPQPVLQAYLVNGEPVQQVFLEWVAPLEGFYDRKDYGIAGAEITLYPLDAFDTQDTLHLVQHSSSDSTWIYVPVSGQSLIPQSRGHYRIEVTQASEGIYLSAETVVPDSFPYQISPAPVYADTLDTLTRMDPNLYLNWEGADSAGGYMLNVICLTPRDSVVPLDPDFVIGEDELDPEEINLGMIWPLRYDQRDMLVPWFMFQYEGWTQVELQAVAQDYYDYIFSLFRRNQGFDVDLDYNVEGGLGIFAGLSTNRLWVYMERVE